MTFAIIQKWNPSIHGESPEQLYRPDNKYIVLHALTYPEYNNKDFGVFSKIIENGEAPILHLLRCMKKIIMYLLILSFSIIFYYICNKKSYINDLTFSTYFSGGIYPTIS